MTEPRRIDFSTTEPVSHDADVDDGEADVDGTRWALVEYAPGAGRADWCDTPHCGYVLSGDAHVRASRTDATPLRLAARRRRSRCPSAPRHRGRNEGDEPARLFIIDALRVAPPVRGKEHSMDSGATRVVAVDVGGTFTDVCVLDQGSGELKVAKVASTERPDRRRDGRGRAGRRRPLAAPRCSATARRSRRTR